MLIKENIFQHQLCLFSPGDGHLQKHDVMQFLPKHMEANKFQRTCNDKKAQLLDVW